LRLGFTLDLTGDRSLSRAGLPPLDLDLDLGLDLDLDLDRASDLDLDLGRSEIDSTTAILLVSSAF